MARLHRIDAKRWIVACFIIYGTAHAEASLLDRVGSIFDNIGHGLSFVGKKAGDLVGPGLGLGEKDSGEFAYVRQFSDRHPVGSGAVVALSSEFGEIRVATWPNQVVQVAAEISVGADSADGAEQIASAIGIHVTPAADRIEIQTHLPDTRHAAGNVSISVNYTLTIPDDASLTVENYFGDTIVRDVGGTVTIKSQYGLVDIRQVSGPVQVRTRGAFTLEARGLEQGGSFELNGAHAVFSDIAGSLKVNNFSGPIELYDLAPEVELDITNEGGPISLHLPEDAAPDVVATCLFGGIKSDIELRRTSQGHLTIARSANVESKRHISLRSSFGDIYIKREGRETEPGPALVEGTSPFKDVLTYTEMIPEGTEFIVEAISGDVRVEGVDEDRVHVTATQLVRVRDKDNAQAALEALVVRVEKEEGRLLVRTRVIDDMTTLGCPAYRIDLAIQCPRTSPIVVRAEDGHTAIGGTGAAIRVEQAAGAITVEHAKGALDLTNHKGDVRVLQCAGPIQVAAWYGAIELNEVYGNVVTTCEQGKTIIESLDAGAVVHNRGGDVRIIALEGIKGDYDIQVEQGNLSILLPASTDAAFEVVAENGTVYSAIPLTGTINRGVQEFHGRLTNGSHRVTLRAEDGDIRIN